MFAGNNSNKLFIYLIKRAREITLEIIITLAIIATTAATSTTTSKIVAT